jgi:hypothetical protein
MDCNLDRKTARNLHLALEKEWVHDVYFMKWEELILIKELGDACLEYEVYKDFIKGKDIGIEIVENSHNVFRIINEKKWFLSKIKYGL